MQKQKGQRQHQLSREELLLKEERQFAREELLSKEVARLNEEVLRLQRQLANATFALKEHGILAETPVRMFYAVKVGDIEYGAGETVMLPANAARLWVDGGYAQYAARGCD